MTEIEKFHFVQTGIYICIASNSHGQVERDFQLTVLGLSVALISMNFT